MAFESIAEKCCGQRASPGTLASEEASARHRASWLASISAWLENEAVLGYVLMTPALLLIVVFIAYPFSLGVWLSLTDKLVGRPAHFIGLRNFTHLFESQIFLGTVWNTVLFTFSATVLKAVLGMWLAVLLNRKIRFARFIRATRLTAIHCPYRAQRPGLAVDVRCHVQCVQLGRCAGSGRPPSGSSTRISGIFEAPGGSATPPGPCSPSSW